MQRFQSLVCGIALAGLTAAPLAAQNKNTRAQGDRAAAGQLDSKTRGANIRVSQLTGMNIQNPQGESVGEINDLVLDASTGKVHYAAVTYGGFLGIGNKMFAVPFEAFKVQHKANDSDETVLVLDVTPEQLEGSVGFDENNWPDFADKEYTAEIYKRYKIERIIRDRRDRVDVDVNRDGVDVDVERK